LLVVTKITQIGGEDTNKKVKNQKFRHIQSKGIAQLLGNPNLQEVV
jgi:hypothetical protein